MEEEQEDWAFLASLPALPLSRVACFLDIPSLRSFRQTCTSFHFVSNKLARLGAGCYHVLDACEFLQRQANGDNILRQPIKPFYVRVNQCEKDEMKREELDVLSQLTILDAKMESWALRRNQSQIGSLTVNAMAEKLLPPDFANYIRRFGFETLRNLCGINMTRFKMIAGSSRPVVFGPRKLIQYKNAIARLQDQEMKDVNYDEEDEEDEVETEGFVPSDIERLRINMIISLEVSEDFYNLKQDALNGIVNVVEDQFTFCCKVLRFNPVRNDINCVDLAQTVALVSGNSLLTPDRVYSLYTNGFCVIDDFLPLPLVSQVYVKCIHFVQQTAKLLSLPPEELARIQGTPPFLMTQGDPPSARGDCLMWLHRDSPPGNEVPFSLVMDSYSRLYEEVSAVVKLQGGREAQLAFYPDQGQGYRRHRDATPDNGEQISDNRRITAITYCNPSWEPQHGGRLRMWLTHLPESPVVELEPRPGRMLLFLSGLIDHEVRPSYHARVAITNWFW